MVAGYIDSIKLVFKRNYSYIAIIPQQAMFKIQITV